MGKIQIIPKDLELLHYKLNQKADDLREILSRMRQLEGELRYEERSRRNVGERLELAYVDLNRRISNLDEMADFILKVIKKMQEVDQLQGEILSDKMNLNPLFIGMGPISNAYYLKLLQLPFNREVGLEDDPGQKDNEEWIWEEGPPPSYYDYQTGKAQYYDWKAKKWKYLKEQKKETEGIFSEKDITYYFAGIKPNSNYDKVDKEALAARVYKEYCETNPNKRGIGAYSVFYKGDPSTGFKTHLEKLAKYGDISKLPDEKLDHLYRTYGVDSMIEVSETYHEFADSIAMAMCASAGEAYARGGYGAYKAKASSSVRNRIPKIRVNYETKVIAFPKIGKARLAIAGGLFVEEPSGFNIKVPTKMKLTVQKNSGSGSGSVPQREPKANKGGVNTGKVSQPYIPKDANGNPIPLAKQTVNGQDIPLPDPAAQGRPHTVLGGSVSSKTGEVYRQSATFPGETWPKANGQNVPWSEVHWGDHGTPHHHTNPHQHIFEYNPDKGGWIRKGPSKY